MRPGLLGALRLLLQLLWWHLDLSAAGNQSGDGCGHSVLTSYSGTLSSKNFPGTYPNSTSCEWQIHGEEGSPLSLAFGDMDIEASEQCKYGFLLLSSPSDGSSFGPFCGSAYPPRSVLVMNSTSITILFNSTKHRSGRGFLLSYASGNRSDLISCLQKGIHYNTEQIRVYCPAGCKGVAGDIWGNVNQGYRDTSVLCKAAVHAGVILDELGGPIVISQEKGVTLYKSSVANGLHSKRGSLSEKRLIFHKACAGALEVASFSASSCWHEQNILGDHPAWAAEQAALAAAGSSWAADHSSANEWLEIDLGKKRNITGIVTKGSSHKYNYYVKSYQVQFSRDGKNWKTYKSGGTKEEKIFEGNSDNYQEVSNAFIPPILARYLRVVPQSWNQRAALKVEVLGCQIRQKYIEAEGQNNPKVFLGVTSTPILFTTIPGIVMNPEKTGPPLLAMLLVGGSLLIAATVLLLVFLCYKKSRKAPAQNDGSFTKGCLIAEASQVCSRGNLQLSASEIASFPGPGTPVDLLGAQSPEYAEPDLVQVNPGCQVAPSTFKPAVDEGYTLPLVVNPYDVPAKQHEYTEPLALEPEYATPFMELPAEVGRGPCGTNLGVQRLPFSESRGGCLAPPGPHESSLQYDFPAQCPAEKLESQAGETGQQERSIQTDLGCLPPLPNEWTPRPGDKARTASFQGRHFQQRNPPYEHVYHKPL
ncbi:discoidin, CUB and LCCL domain-containing protein 1-like isoform X1 [Pseudonaja textilis]|uniref:discoidin, CUB and LCCL domain-containing protein 1-like isoform X1 n=1 Tax=Pseudonaja textilis TaxID=8673 RepID=UPI000EA8DBB6|nr:discoidin, CUB and LCCL domain-containing protein 1-like isoform X1 [Pseudonaja textilis]